MLLNFSNLKVKWRPLTVPSLYKNLQPMVLSLSVDHVTMEGPRKKPNIIVLNAKITYVILANLLTRKFLQLGGTRFYLEV